MLGVSQQQIASFEIGRRRVPVSLLTAWAAGLAVAVEELIGPPGRRPAGKRGPAPKLQQQLERIGQLPKAKQKMASEVLDSLLAPLNDSSCRNRHSPKPFLSVIRFQEASQANRNEAYVSGISTY